MVRFTRDDLGMVEDRRTDAREVKLFPCGVQQHQPIVVSSAGYALSGSEGASMILASYKITDTPPA